MAEWRDEGTLWDSAGPKVGEWFPVNTQTGEWGTPTPTLASAAGVPDVGPSPLPSTPMLGGMPDQAPLSIGQVAGNIAHQVTTPRSMQRVQRLDDLGALPPKPGVWEAIARGVGMASPQGRAMLQHSDQQSQQQLQNQLAARRQALAEEQNERAEIRDDFTTFVKLSEVKSKALRNLYTDRWVADMQARGKSLPADLIEAFKKTGLDDGKNMAKLLEPLLTESGLDPAIVTQILDEGGSPKDIMDAMELAQKQKKLRLEQQEITGLDASRQQMFGTVGDASGGTPPAGATTAPPEPPLASVSMQGSANGKAPLPIRMNNPLNIKQGPATQKWIDQGVAVVGDPAQDGGRFIKFQTPQHGVQAAQDLLTGPTYSGLSVDAALKKWSNNGYGGEIVTGVDATKKIADLTPGELTRTMGAMIQREGGGTSRSAVSRDQVAGPGAPSQEPARLAQLNQQIAAMDQFLQANIGRGSERTRAAVTQVERLRDNLTKERDQLTEPSRAGARTQVEAEIKADVEEKVKGRQTAAEVLGDRVTTFYDKATGEQESPGQSMSEMRSRLSEKKVAVLSTDQSKQLSVLKQLEPVLDGYKRLVEYAYGPKGPLKDFSRQPLETVSAMWDQAGQKDPQLQAMRRSLEGQLQSVVRGLGARGDLNAQELDAAKQMLANFDASLGLGISAGAGLGRGGIGPMIGIKPTISVPDTPETGMRVANELVDLVNKRIGSLLGNTAYARTKLLEIPEPPKVNPDDPRYGFGMIPPEVMEAKQQRARQAPQAPAQPAASGQRALKAMSPEQLRQLPDALARAVLANPGMEQGLSPEQMDALADGMERWERSQARR